MTEDEANIESFSPVCLCTLISLSNTHTHTDECDLYFLNSISGALHVHL